MANFTFIQKNTFLSIFFFLLRSLLFLALLFLSYPLFCSFLVIRLERWGGNSLEKYERERKLLNDYILAIKKSWSYYERVSFYERNFFEVFFNIYLAKKNRSRLRKNFFWFNFASFNLFRGSLSWKIDLLKFLECFLSFFRLKMNFKVKISLYDFLDISIVVTIWARKVRIICHKWWHVVYILFSKIKKQMTCYPPF
jgi:hypothetical protein